MKKPTSLSLPLLLLVGLSAPSIHADGQRTAPPQDMLGPGVYVYQTRLDTATCEEDSNSGFTNSYFAAIDGTPGARQMSMSILNSEFWPVWGLVVRADGTLVGDATLRNETGPGVARSHFELRRQGGQLVGRGFREYSKVVDGRRRRCRNDFDALLRRLDLRPN